MLAARTFPHTRPLVYTAYATHNIMHGGTSRSAHTTLRHSHWLTVCLMVQPLHTRARPMCPPNARTYARTHVRTRARTCIRLGGSAMMTEGLACGGNNRSDFDECVEVMDGLDEHLYSWTDYGDSQGALWQPSALQQQVWARSYAPAVAGMPLNMTFDDGNPKGTEQANRGRSTSSGSTNTSTGSGSGSGKASFEFCWTLDTQITASTEIFASTKYHYPNGVVVRTTPNVVASPSPTGNSDIWTVDPTLEAAEEASVGRTERAVQPAVACVWLNAK